MTQVGTSKPKSGRVMRREIGLIGLTWASVGSIIGSGWLYGAWKGVYTAGPAALIAWLIGGVAVLVLGLVHAELGAMYPVSGGTARFPHYAFGGLAGASFGWFSWIQAATVAPIEVMAAIGYAQHYSFAKHWMNSGGDLRGFGLVVAVLFMAALVAVNFLGIKKLTNVNSTLTWWKVAVPVLTIIVVGLTNFHGSHFSALNGFSPYGAKGVLSAVASSGIVFAYLGFEQADQLAGEAKDPQKNLPRAVIGSVVIGIIIYILLQAMFIGALPASVMHGTWADLQQAFHSPWAQLASGISLSWLAVLLYIDAVVSPSGTGLIYATSTSRVSFGLSRNGYFPKIFESLTSRGVPWFGLIVSFVVGSICFLPFPSWSSLVNLITSASVLMYAGAPLALGVFRKRLPKAERPYTMRGASVLGPIAFILSNYIIMWSGWVTDYKLGLAILVGVVLIGANALLNGNPIKPNWDAKAANWLLPYLLGVGFLTWGSAWGHADGKHAWFGSSAPWWDLALMAIFSLVIYYWAIAVSLPGEQIEETINAVVIPEETLMTVGD